LKPALAVAALAAFCACAAAAPLSSRQQQHFIIRAAPVAVPLFEIPLDPDLAGPDVEAAELPGFKPDSLAPGAQTPAQPALVPATFSSLTLLAFGCVLIVSRRNLKIKPGRRRVRRYVTRLMAYCN
jgi:hypothetical protein